MPKWNIYKVTVRLDQIAAGLSPNLPNVQFAVANNKPSNKEVKARAALGEEIIPEGVLVAGIIETLDTEAPTELAVFRRCREHGAIYIPHNYPRAVFQDAADTTSRELRITSYVVSGTMQFWPGVIHLKRNGDLLTQADENRELRGSVIGFRGPRSIVQACEVIYEPELEFFAFALSKAKSPGPVTAAHIDGWLSTKQSAFSPHRKMGFGGMVDWSVETVAEGWEGAPVKFAPDGITWEREPFTIGWSG